VIAKQALPLSIDSRFTVGRENEAHGEIFPPSGKNSCHSLSAAHSSKGNIPKHVLAGVSAIPANSGAKFSSRAEDLLRKHVFMAMPGSGEPRLTLPTLESKVDRMEDLARPDRLAALRGDLARSELGDFGRRYQEHGVEIMAFVAARIGQSQAEDVCQEIWLKVATSNEKFKGGSFRGWLFEVARNHLIDRSRRRETKQAQKTVSIHCDDSDGSPRELPIAATLEADADEDERLGRLNRCLEKLDATYLQIVRGWLSSAAYAAFAPQLGLTPEQAQRRFHTAKENLRECLEGSSI